METGVPGPTFGLGENDNSPIEPDLHRMTEFTLGAKSKYVTCASESSLAAFETSRKIRSKICTVAKVPAVLLSKGARTPSNEACKEDHNKSLLQCFLRRSLRREKKSM